MSAYELTKTILKDSANLKAYYRMESGALTTDSSGNSKTLTNNNTVADGTGVYGGGADFSASNTNKSLRISDDLGINATNAMSISVWVKLNAEIGSGTWCFVDKLFAGASGTTMQILYEYNAGTRRIAFRRLGTANAYIYYTLTMGTSSWYHFVFTWDGTNIRGFVNSTHVGVTASSGTFNLGAYATNVSIGATNATDNTQFSSIIADDCAFFSTALSADQIKELYEGRYIGEWMPQSNLVGLWHLNGNSTDTSGNNNHGTDTTITYGSANGIMGTQGTSLNGTASKIVLTNASPLKPTGSYTVSAWVNATGFSATTRGIFHTQSRNTAVAGIALFCTSGGALKLQQGNNTGTTINTNYKELTGATLSTGIWYWIVGVYDDGNTMKLYVNGAESATVANTIDPAYAATTYIRIGCQNDTGTDKNFWNGKIDEVAIFSRALTAAEIRKWYAWSVGRYL